MYDARRTSGCVVKIPVWYSTYSGRDGLALEDRHCYICTNRVEDEEHVLLHCPMYQEIRQTLFDKIITSNRDFLQKTNIEMLCFIFGYPDDHNIIFTLVNVFLSMNSY